MYRSLNKQLRQERRDRTNDLLFQARFHGAKVRESDFLTPDNDPSEFSDKVSDEEYTRMGSWLGNSYT